MRTAPECLQDSIKQALVRLHTARGIVGSGFLVSPSHVLTCAHVADHAEQGEVVLDFPFVARDKTLTAWVASRHPATPLVHFPPNDGLDVALLQLKSGAPSGSRPARLVKDKVAWNQKFRSFGFPPRYDDGVWVEGSFRDEQVRGWVELDRLSEGAYFIAPGFSGSAVWSETYNGVVGMIVAADRNVSGTAAYMLPTHRLLKAVPLLATSEAGRQVNDRNKCLLLMPYLADLVSQHQQQEDVRDVIQPAIEQSGLVLPRAHVNGLAVDDIREEWIPEVCEAEIVVVDANSYGTGSCGLSPYLYYLLGMRHTRGNDTILVSRSESHLPFSLQRKPHTLTYNPSKPRSVRDFTESFHDVVLKIQARADTRPDNPIQEYHEKLASQAQLNRSLAEKEELERYRMEAELRLRQQRTPTSEPRELEPGETKERIVFRPTGPRPEGTA